MFSGRIKRVARKKSKDRSETARLTGNFGARFFGNPVKQP